MARVTSSKLGRLQKNFNPISRANIVTSGTRNRSTALVKAFFQPHFSCLYRDYGTRNISKAWWTSKKIQSHFWHQYRESLLSQHLQSLVEFKQFSIAFLTLKTVTSGTRNISNARSPSKYFIRISHTNIVTNGSRNISTALAKTFFQSHLTRQ